MFASWQWSNIDACGPDTHHRSLKDRVELGLEAVGRAPQVLSVDLDQLLAGQ
jgi:hypothetical protein